MAQPSNCKLSKDRLTNTVSPRKTRALVLAATFRIATALSLGSLILTDTFVDTITSERIDFFRRQGRRYYTGTISLSNLTRNSFRMGDAFALLYPTTGHRWRRAWH